MHNFRYILLFTIFLIQCSSKTKPIVDLQPAISDGYKIAFGSCNKHHLDQSYWDQIRAHHPDVWIWLGDIVYADTDNMGKLREMYNEQESNPHYHAFADSSRIFGIWDDHDYGLNDGGEEFKAKAASKNELFAFLDIPETSASRLHEGVYQSYIIEEQGLSIKLILLDTRYFRGALVRDPSGQKRYLEASEHTMLGDAQWAWLEQELKASSADFHIIGSGIQMIPTEHGFEKWANFPQERRKLFKMLEQYDPKGTILISGDRHIAEISQLKTSMRQGMLTEVTSSGLTHAYEQTNSEKEPNTFRLGELYPEKNYGILSFNKRGQKSIEIQLWGMKNNLLAKHKLVFPQD